ncbi:CD1375 family protein [Brevibacillus porteri]|uniref:CD1375 family protein n=1 Tax=Brevibacillus porteri TaxID=2126350 RepID=UPI003D1D534C
MLKRLWIWLLFLCLKGGEVTMVTVCVSLIINGRRTFTQIPASLQADVKADLEAIGLGIDGKPLA